MQQNLCVYKAEEEARLKAEEEKKLTEQLNSFSMMYYLAITAEEIHTPYGVIVKLFQKSQYN